MGLIGIPQYSLVSSKVLNRAGLRVSILYPDKYNIFVSVHQPLNLLYFSTRYFTVLSL